ncbi:MAG: hypothetical protein AMJ53_06125 [Gammaproteobacteria bacterium SG8_11]|nr:MAG: hypothetical protein AMJ53_06125 [Gammaproteobacteria bacterium SG8_11]
MPKTEKEAIEKARFIVEKEGWPWLEPVKAGLWEYKEKKSLYSKSAYRKKWSVTTNYLNRGANVKISFEAETGEVLEKVWSPR